jgi:hypothetical protein
MSPAELLLSALRGIRKDSAVTLRSRSGAASKTARSNQASGQPTEPRMTCDHGAVKHGLRVALLAAALVTSCARVSAPAPAATASPSLTQTYELREKCGRDAREWFQHAHPDTYTREVLGKTTERTQVSYENHYNEKRNRCFVVVREDYSASYPGQPTEGSVSMTLLDVNENKELGSVYDPWPSKSDVQHECTVADQKCTSRDAWVQLAAPYMKQ